MKLKQWLYGAAALTMMAACSDKDIAPDLGGAPTEEGQGYFGINIQLPTDNITRANDDFGNGETSESVVSDAVLLLFQGIDEASATFKGAFTLQEADPTLFPEGEQITRRSVRVANVSGLDFKNNLYALVMVNGIANKLYELDKPEAAWMKNPDGTGKTIRQFQEATILRLGGKYTLYDQPIKGEEYASSIFMTNSPLSQIPGGAGDSPIITNALPTLVKLDPTVYETQSEAIAKPAGTIHVERIVGKVTCSNFNKETDLTIKVNGYDYKLAVDSIWWQMAQDMNETNAVRNTNRNPVGKTPNAIDYLWRWHYASSYVDNMSNLYYRMLGYTPINVVEGEVTKSYYRPYFCQVPGYNKAKLVPAEDDSENSINSEVYEDKNFRVEEMNFDDENNPPVAWKSTSSPGAFYPLENTFPVEYMKYANTTRIGFWVTFSFIPQDNAPALDWSSTNFYINGMDKSTLYLDDKNGYNPLENLAIAELSNVGKYKPMWEAIKNAVETEEGGNIDNINIADLIIFSPKNTEDGKVAISSIRFKKIEEMNGDIKSKFAKEISYTFNSNRISELNNLGTYYKYEGGRAFYEVRVKHFGDDQTPWDGSNLNQATTIDQSYGETVLDRNTNYLGRYGIVRNNWYDIQVTSITRLGDPKDPAIWDHSWPGKPDDNKDQYIAVEMKVLSWAKRSQSEIF